MNQTVPPKVFITARESVCDECGEELGRKAWIMLAGDRGALCLACADLDRLVFLPAGDAALTRRARKHSDEAVDLAVIAHIRHAETQYDRLLQRCWDRRDARATIAEDVYRIRVKWGRSE
ncbi:MAG: DUF2293 domain-containing protein [Pirellulales bacterium]